MALREFSPLIDPHFQQAPAPPAPVNPDDKTGQLGDATDHPVTDAVATEPALDAALPASDSLALEMDRAKQALLALLLENPLSGKMLAEQLEIAGNESGEDAILTSEQISSDNIVQNSHFVQLENPPTPDCRPIHYLPTVLLKIAEQILPLSTANPVYQNQLQHACRHLHTSRQNMIAANIGLVRFVAYKQKTSLSVEDLVQEGTVGLIKAVDRFDPYRGIRFSTYAIFWIKQAIFRLIVKQEKVVRLPVALAEKAPVVFEAMRNGYLENNRWPSHAELQARCELSLDDIKTISGYYHAAYSLDASVSEGNDDLTLMDSLKQTQFALPLDWIIAKNLNFLLGKVIASLSEKEAMILNMRFGLKNHTEMTLQAVADQLDLTRERVRQIQNAALKKLKQQFGQDLLPFLDSNEG